MEKKNTLLLTVVAVATLLVAVVGASFAYFSITVSKDSTTSAQNSTKATTKAYATATMSFGNKVTGTNVLPGYKAVRSITIKGGGASTSQAVATKITVKPTIDSAFGSDVTWSLYKSSTAITCTSSETSTNGQYYDNATCKVGSAALSTLTPVLTGSTTSKTLNVDVSYNTNDTYYLVVEYANNTSANQNAQQGKTFEVVLDYAAA